VGDDQYCSNEVIQSIFQHFGRDNIKIVGRLIQQQEVGVRKDQQCQLQTRAFTSRKRAYLFTGLFVSEQLTQQEGHGVGFAQFPGSPDNVDERHIQVECLVFLGIITDLDTGTDFDFTRIWCIQAEN
jgi:hypothetical protein